MDVITVTGENFESEVMDSDKLVLVDFWAEWCGPCRLLSPVIEEFAAEYAGKVKVCKVNVDEERDLAMKFQVGSIPTVILMKNGSQINLSFGCMSKSQLEEMLKPEAEGVTGNSY